MLEVRDIVVTEAGRRRSVETLAGSADTPLTIGLLLAVLGLALGMQARGRQVMETQSLHRGRLIDHIQLVVEELAPNRRFYGAVLEALGVQIGGEGDGYFWADELFVSTADSAAAQGVLTGRHHLAFQAADRATVDAFYRAALANGGADNGAPGERPYHPGYYAAFVTDPAGNNVEAVFHGDADRSAPSVRIRF